MLFDKLIEWLVNVFIYGIDNNYLFFILFVFFAFMAFVMITGSFVILNLGGG